MTQREILNEILSEEEIEVILNYYRDWINNIRGYSKEVHEDYPGSEFEPLEPETLDINFNDYLHEFIKERVADYSWSDETDLYTICHLFMMNLYNKEFKTIND